MKNMTIDVLEKMERNTFLNSRDWDPDWLEYLCEASPFLSRSGIYPIHAILPIPGKKESLVVYGEESYCHSNYRTLATLLRSDFGLSAERLVLRLTMDELGCFQERLHPMILDWGALFPVKTPKHATWLNPLSIYEIREDGPERTFISMASGPGVCVKPHKETIEKFAANALLALACLRRDLHQMNYHGCVYPLDFMELPNTPFARTICEHEILQTFPIDRGDFRDRYIQKGFIFEVLDTVRDSGLELFDYTTIQIGRAHV